MATQIVNAETILDALADSIGRTVTPQQKLKIVEEFIGDIDGTATNEEKATEFNRLLLNIIAQSGNINVQKKAKLDVQASINAAIAASGSNALT